MENKNSEKPLWLYILLFIKPQNISAFLKGGNLFLHVGSTG
jgi:hypothetical protein